MEVSREEMADEQLGAARAKAPTAWRLVDIEMDEESPTFTYALNRKKLRRMLACHAKGVILSCAPISPRTIPHCCGKYYIQLKLPWNRHLKNV